MAKKEFDTRNSENTSDLVFIPMPITMEKALEMGYRRKDIVYRRLGYYRYPCILVKGTREQFEDWQRTFDRERKKKDRDERCLTADGHGGFIMCPECNHCSECLKIGSIDFETFLPISLDSLKRDDEEHSPFEVPASIDVAEEATTHVLVELIVRFLETCKKMPYAEIFLLIYEYDCTITEVAAYFNIPWSTAKDRVKNMRKLITEYTQLEADDLR